MQTDDAFPSLSNSWNEQDWHKRISGLCLIRVRNSLCCRNWQILKMNISKQHWRPITASWLSYKCWNVPQCYKACIHLSEASLRQRKQGNITRIFSPWVYTTSKTRTRMSPGTGLPVDAWSRTCDSWFLYHTSPFALPSFCSRLYGFFVMSRNMTDTDETSHGSWIPLFIVCSLLLLRWLAYGQGNTPVRFRRWYNMKVRTVLACNLENISRVDSFSERLV